MLRNCCIHPNKLVDLLSRVIQKIHGELTINQKVFGKLVEFCKYNQNQMTETLSTICRQIDQGGQIQKISLQLLNQLFNQLKQLFDTNEFLLLLQRLSLYSNNEQLALCEQILACEPSQQIVDTISTLILKLIKFLPLEERSTYITKVNLCDLKLSQSESNNLTEHLFLYSLVNEQPTAALEFELLLQRQFDQLSLNFHYSRVTYVFKVIQKLQTFLQNLPVDQQKLFNAKVDSKVYNFVLKNSFQQLKTVDMFLSEQRVIQKLDKPNYTYYYASKLIFQQASLLEPQCCAALLQEYLDAVNFKQELFESLSKMCQRVNQSFQLVEIVTKIPLLLLKDENMFNLAAQIFQSQPTLILSFIKQILILQNQDLVPFCVKLIHQQSQVKQLHEQKSKLFNLLTKYIQKEGQNSQDDFFMFLQTVIELQPEKRLYYYLVGRKYQSQCPESPQQLVSFYQAIAHCFGLKFPQQQKYEGTGFKKDLTRLIKNLQNCDEIVNQLNHIDVENMNIEQVMQKLQVSGDEISQSWADFVKGLIPQ